MNLLITGGAGFVGGALLDIFGARTIQSSYLTIFTAEGPNGMLNGYVLKV